MGKFKQLQIEFDDDYFNMPDPEEDEEEPMPEYDSALEDVTYYLDKVFMESLKKATKIKCEHEAKLSIRKKLLVTYCKKCGKILHQAKKR